MNLNRYRRLFIVDASIEMRGENILEEKELIVRLKQGEKQAFDLLYEKYKNTAMRMAYFITNSKTNSEDIVQESFIKCYQNISKLRDNEGFRPWLFKILTRTAWKHCKKYSKEIPQEEVTLWQDKEIEESSLDIILKEENSVTLMKFVSSLPVKQRLVVTLYYYNELSTKEIAKILGCLEGTVKSRLFNARKTLKEMLIQESNKEVQSNEERHETRSKNWASI